MSLPVLLDSFQSPLGAVQRLLDHFNNQGVIIGGIAVSLLAEPRFTADADAMHIAPYLLITATTSKIHF